MFQYSYNFILSDTYIWHLHFFAKKFVSSKYVNKKLNKKVKYIAHEILNNPFVFKVFQHFNVLIGIKWMFYNKVFLEILYCQNILLQFFIGEKFHF